MTDTAPSLPRRVLARIRCDASIVHGHDEGDRCNVRCVTLAEFRAEREAHRALIRDIEMLRSNSLADELRELRDAEIQDFLPPFERFET